VHAVIAQQVRIGLDRAEIVDADDFDVVTAALGDGAQDIAADSAETVNGNAYSQVGRSRVLRSASPSP
jgi:hypothetical protein